MALLRFLDFARLLYDKRFYPGKLFLKPVCEIAWSVLEQDDEAKGENDEEGEPEKSPQQCHAKK